MDMTADQLKRKRRDLGLTQVELAKRLGVTRLTVVRWETGVHKIPYATGELIKQMRETGRPRRVRQTGGT